MFYAYVQFGVYTEDRLICFSDETYVPTIKKIHTRLGFVDYQNINRCNNK